MKINRKVFLFLFSAFLCAYSSGQTIYLSPTGSDKNTGNAGSPLSTLNAALDKARELRADGRGVQPVEIIALRGEYYMMEPLTLTVSDSGTDDSPLIIRGEEGQKAVFRGGIQISGWESTDGKTWRAFVPQVAHNNFYFEQLYVNGRRAVRARTPNEGFFRVKSVSETVLEKGTGRAPDLAVQKIDLDSSDAYLINSFSKQDYLDGLIVFYHNWDNTRKRITGFNKTTSSVYTVGEGMKPWNPVNSKSRYLLENFKSALDAPGEWFLDRTGYLYYIPMDGEVIENTSFYAPVIKEFIKISGDQATGKRVRNISFKNLSFEIAGYNTPADGNEPEQAAASVDAVVTIDFASNIKFTDCSVSHTGTYGFWFRRGVSNCSIERCYLHDLGAGGIKIGETVIRQNPDEITNRIVIDNNIITDAGHVFPCAVGIIIFNASDNQLTHNDISNLRYTGISAGWVWGYANSPSKRNKIEFNHIHHLGWGELCDMGGVYTLGASEGTTVSNNVIHHIYSFDYGGWGLYTDEGSYGIVEENNLVYLCKSSGFHQHYGKENTIRNNIFAFNIRSQLQATRIEEHRSITFTNNIIYYDKGTLLSNNWDKFNLLSDQNCYWDTRSREIKFNKMSLPEWQNSGKDVHSVIADPQFTDPGNFDFTFKKQAVARKIGFKVFDYSKAGVYGSEEWKNLAQFDKKTGVEFNEIILKMEAGK